MTIKAGELCRVVRKWALPYDSYDFWSNCGLVLYLGECSAFTRSDGVTIVNHSVFVDGKVKILDRTFIKFFESDNETG